MKKLLFGMFLLALLAPETKANPGDTTWVTIYDTRKITQYGNYDTSAVLPTGKTYRKIRLHYILGRYACPGGTQYCGSWDYTTHVYAKPAGADTVEIARVITPYATDWLTTNRKHDYIIDVTDYSSVLNGNLDFRYVYDGYSWGFTVTLKLELIEGTPPMNAVAVKNIYDGYYAYGKTTDPIENHLIPKPFQYTSPVAKAYVKNIISGHGSDDTGCGEFCSKYYNLKVNGSSVAQNQLWRSDCGLNNVYPQTGTWLYDRANWCPGNIVDPIIHDISTLTSASSTFSLDIDMEPYTSPTQSNAGGYGITSQLVLCSAPNHSLDVSIEDIIAPTIDPNYYRSNNICSHPRIKIKNTGSANVTTVTFNYNLKGGATNTYTWTGNLSFLEEAEVDFGPSLAMFNGNESNEFQVSINQVNGTSGDQNSFNNTYTSTFVDSKSYPNKFVVYFKTNNTAATSGSTNESSWKIIDASGAIVASRINNANNTIYKDTLDLPSGCYRFIMDDSYCDGLSWWVYPNYPTNPGNGILRFSSATTPATFKTFNGDFGCQIIERFTVGYVLNVKESGESNNNFQLFPNPASSNINLLFDVKEYQDVTYNIVDVTGKEVMSGNFSNISSVNYSVNTANLDSGVYFINCKFSKGEVQTKKFIINQ